VLVNLLTNAAKYTNPGGRIALSAGRDGDQIVLQVRDNGTGIAPEMLTRIFDPFAQAEQTLDRSQGGLGIGLALVRGLVELHGGVVSAASEGLGQGSAFTVRLPALPPVPPPEVQAPPAAPDDTPARLARVLVVDDNMFSAETLAALLQLWGHDVQVAHDGPTALELAAVYRPEVVLLDIGLPGMDGYQVARRLREAGLGSAVLIAASGYAQDEDRRRSRDAGFDHHLSKPLDLDVLEALLARTELNDPPLVATS
jgi:two-component system, chemotaxis family, CheB/CheR fusion protein